MALLETTQSNVLRRENIKVAIRVRPTLPFEQHKKEVVYYPQFQEGVLETIKIEDGLHLIESKYDKVFRQNSYQTEVFEFVRESIEGILSGYNATIFAYGQTGSGKTYTMFGPHWEDQNLGYQNTMGPYNGSNFHQDQQKFGLIPNAIEHVFENLEILQQSGEQSYTAYCSFMQIYNEKLFDLFQEKDQQKPLVIREDKYSGIFVEGQSEYVVRNAQECFILLRRGEKNRFTRQTKGNIHSSRSHTIFQLLIESNEPDHNGKILRGKLNLCDLAGSEKIGKEENMDSQHLLELKTINLSLSSLGKVISALAQGKKSQHIPYRDSKLTRLLQDSLGGNTITTLIAAVSPLVDCAEETISTLKFADRAKQILVKIQANEMNAADDARITQLQKEVQYLKDILNMKRKGGANELTTQLLQLKEENSKLKQMAGQVGEVERLKHENKIMKIELQRLKVPSMTDGFQQQKQITNISHQQRSMPQSQQLALIQSVDFKSEEGDQAEQDLARIDKNNPSFFMTETDYFPINQMDQSRMNQNQILNQPTQDRFANNSFIKKQASPMKQQNLSLHDPHSLIIKPQSIIDTPLSSLGGAGQDILSTHSAITNSQFRTGQFSHQTSNSMESSNMTQLSVQQIADKLENQRIQELKSAALGMKGTLVNNGRCPKCTLKPPCKHYEKIEDLPNIVEVQPSLAKKQPNMPPLYPNKDTHTNLLLANQPPIQKQRNDSEATRFTTSSSTYVNQLSSNSNSTPSNNTFQNSGAQMILNQNNNITQNSNRTSQFSYTEGSTQGVNQRVLKELQTFNFTPQQQLISNPSFTTTGTNKSPFGTQSNKSAVIESQILTQNGLNLTQTPVQQKNIEDYKNYQQMSSNGKTPQQSVSYNATFYSNNSNPTRGRDLSLNNNAHQIMQSNTQQNFLSENRIQQQNPNDNRSRTNLDQRKHSQQQKQSNFFRLNKHALYPAPMQQDQIQVRIRGKNNLIETKTGSVTRTLNEIQEQEQHKKDIQKTTERLKVLEKLEKYREEKLKKEIEQYEEQKKKEEDEFLKLRDQEAKRVKYLEKQRGKLDQLRMKKMEDELSKQKDLDKMKEKERMRRKMKEQEQEIQKKKIQEYHYKKRQTEELLANANYVDFEDVQNDEDLYLNIQSSKNHGKRDELEGYVEELSMNQGRKQRAPPAVQ
ncbi:kinesin motor domain containing protein [Stylonychia lemnae]|uniref:Kinesin motor domain containing protein n=1 Tax=Stylonychia lemnae TaxID=5949 RepID=A0A078AC77_STYLE|nr:kinesin motor domain containing protein [Stylonychia lemnae]|eukprot:CDW78383.1 kinesin motor domain containing protein [Stylonychia lemnae]